MLYVASRDPIGNSWDKPIKAHLPYGTSAALKFMTTVVDPSLDHDLYADKPWAVSPLLATMQRVSTETYPADKPVPKLVPGPVDDDLSAITGEASLKGHADKRRTYLATPANRQKIKLSKDTLVTADFSNGFIDCAYACLSVSRCRTLLLTFASSITLRSRYALAQAAHRIPHAAPKVLVSLYMMTKMLRQPADITSHRRDGQPVTFVCRRRDGSKTYFIITFTLEGDAPAAPPPKKEEEKPAEEAAADVDQFDVD